MNESELQRYPLYAMVKHDPDVAAYINEQNNSMKALHYTEHSFAHVGVVSERTWQILTTLGVDEHTVDLALTSCMTSAISSTVRTTP